MPKSGEHKVNYIDSFFRQRPSINSVREGETISFLEDGKLIKQEKRNGVVYQSEFAEAIPKLSTEEVETGVIREIIAGTGLTGGGLSGEITLNVVGGTGIDANANDIAIDSTVATLTGTQTLTNKSIDLDSNTLTGTLTEFNTALQGDSFVSLTGTETLTNKTLAAPTFTGTAQGANLTLTGDLTVQGDTTTLNTATLQVEDNNIVLNYHASNDTSSTADGSGITIQDAVNSTTDATILWDATNDEFDFSHTVTAPDFTGDLTGNADTSTKWASGVNINLSGDVAGSTVLALDGSADVTIGATIQTDAVEAGMLNDNIISGQGALTTAVDDNDELLISDAGVLKRIDVDHFRGQLVGNINNLTLANFNADVVIVDSEVGSVTRNDARFLTAAASESFINSEILSYGYTTNTGTVTSVAVAGGNGLTSSGGPITGSGTITLAVGSDTLSVSADKVDISASALTPVSNVVGSDGFIFFDASATPANSPRLGTVSDLPFTNNAGTVTNIVTGTGISGGPITSTGTLSLALSDVIANSSTANAVLTSDGDGTLTGEANLTFDANKLGIGGITPTFSFGTEGIEIQSSGQNPTLRLDRSDSIFEITARGADTLVYSMSNLPVRFGQNGGERFRLTSTGVVINEDGVSRDFRVEGDTDQNLLFVDGSTDRVGIGTASPSSKTEISHVQNAESLLTLHNDRQDASNVPIFGIAGKQSGTIVGKMSFYRGGGGNSGYMTFSTKETNIASLTEKMRIDGAGNVGIGTNSPGALLDVNGTGYIRTAVFSDAFKPYSGTLATYGNNSSTDHYFVGDVGIGTNSPSKKLHIKDSTNEIVFIESSDANADIVGADTGGSTRFRSQSGSLDFYTGGSASNASASGSSFAMRIDSSQNVGIGTISPNHLLEIESQTNDVEVVQISNDAGGSGDVAGITHLGITHFPGNTYSSTRITAIENGTASYTGHLAFSTRSTNSDSAPAERMRITSTGNVAINEGSRFYFDGVAATGDTYIQSDTADKLRLVVGNRNMIEMIENETDPDQVVIGNGITDVDFIVEDDAGVAVLTVDSSTSKTTLHSLDVTNALTAGSFQLTTLQVANIQYTNGDAAITIASGGGVSLANGLTVDSGAVAFNGGLDMNENNISNVAHLGVDKIFGDADTDTQINFDGSDVMTFDTGNAEAMRIDASQNVGIGNVSPDATLHIGDNSSSFTLGTTSGDSIDLLKLETDSTNANQLIFSSERIADGSTWTTTRERIYRRVDASDMGYIQFGSSFSASVADMISFGEVGVGDYMGITGDGKVGISTNSPTAKLQIGGGTDGKLFYTDGLYNDVTFNGGSGGTNGVWEFVNSGTWGQTRFYVQDANNSVDRLTFDFRGNGTANKILAGTSIGSVGIGTTSPTSKLHIFNGDGSIPDDANNHLLIEDDGHSYLGIGGGTSSDTGIHFMDSGGIRGRIAYKHSSDAMDFKTANAVQMTINSSGNVGIGVSSPASKIHIQEATAGTPASTFQSALKGGLILEDDSTTTANNILIKSHSLGNDEAIGGIKFVSSPDGGNYSWAGIQGLVSTFAAAGQLAFYTAASNTAGATSTERMRIDESGNVGIGVSSPGHKLEVNGNIKGSRLFANDGSLGYASFAFADDQDTGMYSPAQGSIGFQNNGSQRMQLNSVGSLKLDSGGLHDQIGNGQKRIVMPKGGASIQNGSSETGAIKIVLPVLSNNTMISMRIRVFIYAQSGTQGKSFDVVCGGYPYQDGNWYNQYGWIMGAGDHDLNYKIRFGRDANNSIIYIGELNSTWAYPQIYVLDVQTGHAGYSDSDWHNAFSIGFESSAFSNLDSTILQGNIQRNVFSRNFTSAYYNIGNVGIGTASPASKLQVEYTTTSNGSAAIAEFGTSGSGAIAGSAHQVIVGGPSVSDYTGIQIFSDTTTGKGVLSFADGRGANDNWRGIVQYDHSANNMQFWTNATERMRINSTGCIKVGPNGGDTAHTFEIDTSGNANHGLFINADEPRGAGDYALYIDDEDPNGRGTMVIDNVSGDGLKITTQGQYTGLELVANNDGSNPAKTCHINMTSYEGRGNGIFHFDANYSGQEWFSGLRYAGNMTNWHVGYDASGNQAEYIANAKILVDQSGNFHADADVVAFSTTTGSDRRLKKNIKDLPYGLDDVLKLRAVEFDWKEKRGGKHDIGVIAQEIQEVIPEVVNEVKTIGKSSEELESHLSVDYGKIVSVLIKAVQEQQEQINKLEEKLNG
jgi:hypothetical protein